MIELTPDQQRALAVLNGEPLRVVDPATRTVYVILRADDFDLLTGVVPPPSEETVALLGSQMVRSQQAFWRDLPELLKSWRHRGKWVAYHGDERVGIAKSKTELCQRCDQVGIPPGDYYIGKIEDHETAPWVPTPIEESLFEFTDDPLPPEETS